MNTTVEPTQQTALSLTITRVFDAPRELLWRAWTQPEQFQRWMVPGEGVQVKMTAKDIRAGGTYSLEFQKPDGPKIVSGVYREVVEPERLVFTWKHDTTSPSTSCGSEVAETVVTLEFRALGKRTELTLKHEGFSSIESRDGHNGGWNCCLDGLAKYVKTV